VELGVRIGIAQGEAVVGDCGAPPELNDFTAVGRVVNLASRLCDEAGGGEHADVLISVEAARAEAAGLTALGAIEPRGWGDPVRVWTV
jgi:class 3 adenylate cyclase